MKSVSEVIADVIKDDIRDAYVIDKSTVEDRVKVWNSAWINAQRAEGLR